MESLIFKQFTTITLLFSALFLSHPVQSQVTDGEKHLRNISLDGEKGWKTENNLTISFSQVSLTNWSAGGQNSMSVNGRFNGFYNYKKQRMAWDNQVDLGYGLMKQGKTIWQKTDDRFEVMSKLGYRLNENLNGAAMLNFKSQFTPGYSKPEGGEVISDLFAPAYLLGAIGLDLKKGENFTLFASPLTAKTTFVLNDSLSNAGAYGVDPGKKFRAEVGGYIRVMYKLDVMKNVTMQTKLDLFSNYLKNPQYVDVNWEVFVLMKINKYLSLNINTLMIYDHDIEIGKDTNDDGTADSFKPRIQFKELVGVGLSFTIK
ncbi:MAG: DUF3078 domain-containing protein [Bacteroidales bacterium]|nr:DUF3078 domain-containing protein [Bacteroidales bacterium]